MTGTNYPTGIDGNLELPLVIDLVNQIVADDVNRLRNAIISIETELGSSPSGVYGTVGERLEGIEYDLDNFTGNGSLSLTEMAAPATPNSGFGVLYEKTDGYLYFKNDSGSEFNLNTNSIDLSGATFLTLSSNSALSNERVLTAGGGISLVDGGANSSLIAELSTSGVVAGSYTSADITIDGYGRITTAANGSGGASFGDGTALLPSLTLGTVADPNTGFWHPAADTLAASTNGVERWRLDSNGKMSTVVSSGNVAYEGSVVGLGVKIKFDPAAGRYGFGLSTLTHAFEISAQAAPVTLRLTNTESGAPQARLVMSGNSAVVQIGPATPSVTSGTFPNENFGWDMGSASANQRSVGYFIRGAGGGTSFPAGHSFATGKPGSGNPPTERLRIGEDNDASLGGTWFNRPGADYDFRISGDTRPALFFVDAGTDRVGINRSAGTHGATFDIDNLAIAESIFIARDNGTAVFTIADGGNVTATGSMNIGRSAIANTISIFSIQNTSGTSNIYRTATSPNSLVTGSIGDIVIDGYGDGYNGSFYFKKNGSATNTGWEALASADPSTATLTSAISVVLDFNPILPTTKILDMNHDIVFTTSALSGGRSIAVKLKAISSSRALTFPAGWIFLGAAAPTSLASGKTAVLSATAFGTLDSDIIAAYSAEP